MEGRISLKFIFVILPFFLLSHGCGGSVGQSSPGQAEGLNGEFTVETGQGGVTLDWKNDGGGKSSDPSADAVICDIYLASEPGVTRDNYFLLRDGALIRNASFPYTITGLDLSKTYYFALYPVIDGVEADNGFNISTEDSHEVDVATDGGLAPSAVDVAGANAGAGEVTVSWSAPSDWAAKTSGSYPTQSYTIYYQSGGAAGASSPKIENIWRGQNSYTVTGLSSGVENCFGVTQTKETLGEGPMGAQKCATPQSAASGKMANIIVIVVDTLRADHLSTHGYARNTSPGISKFAQTSYMFNRAIASSSWTLPSFASLLLSKHSFNHDMHHKDYDKTKYVFLSSLLKNAGYKTVSIQRNDHVYNMALGVFDHNMYYIRDDSDAVSAAISYLDSMAPGKKYFMFIGLFNPHSAYKVNNPYFGGYLFDPLYTSHTPVDVLFISATYNIPIYYWDLTPELQSLLGVPPNMVYYQDSRIYTAAYNGEINTSDYEINRLFEHLKSAGVYDDTLIVVTADHGEHMDDHEPYFTHGQTLYNALIHVPLLIKPPKQAVPAVIDQYVRLIDVMPTIFDYVPLDLGNVDGVSLLPIMRGTETVVYDKRPVLSYVKATDTGLVSVILDNYKLIKAKSGMVELYDLDADPGEKTNLASIRPDIANSMKSYLSNYFTEF